MTKRIALWALAALLAGSCGTTPTNFYHLEPLQANLPAIADHRARLVVEPVRLPRYLDRSDIVTRMGGTRLSVSETERWAEPLDEAIARVLRGDLAYRLADWRILVLPPDFAEAAARVDVTVSRFDVSGADNAVLAAQWRIVRERDGRELVLRQSDYVEPVAGEDYAAITAALNRTLHALSHDIAIATAELLDAGQIR